MFLDEYVRRKHRQQAVILWTWPLLKMVSISIFVPSPASPNIIIIVADGGVFHLFAPSSPSIDPSSYLADRHATLIDDLMSR